MSMLETGELEEPYHSLTTRIVASSKRAVAMVGDLLDFTRGLLGGGIPVERAEMSLGKVAYAVVDEIRAAHPDAKIRVETRGETEGRWDAARLGQAIVNLVGNAVQHGADGSASSVVVGGDKREAYIAVHNCGPVIAPERLDSLFTPMRTRPLPSKAKSTGPTGSLGLGLYIAERIVSAHGGRIAVGSNEKQGTTFTMRLPRE